VQPFTTLTSVAAPLLRDDINTDQICPVLPLRVLDPDYAAQLFAHWRRNPDGSEKSGFVLDQDRFRHARILVAGRNFGSGSARESAAWAVADFGIRCIIARSFGELFRGNCIRNGILTIALPAETTDAFESSVLAADGGSSFTVDLVAQRISHADGATFEFQIDPADRNALLEGLDEIGLTLQNADDIARWEQRTRDQQPWLQTMERVSPEKPRQKTES
jgi:3-isopropylmalate/(R)-2-methylmalate dehydratase small subunit